MESLFKLDKYADRKNARRNGFSEQEEYMTLPRKLPGFILKRAQEDSNSTNHVNNIKNQENKANKFPNTAANFNQVKNLVQAHKSNEKSQYVQCSINIADPSGQVYSAEINKILTLSFEEAEQLISSLKEIESVRKKEIHEKQERRSQELVQKIAQTEEGIEILEEYSIEMVDGVWYQVIEIFSEENRSEKLLQNLNFFISQQSWILECWLSKISAGCVIKAHLDEYNKQVYKVSFSFSDQTYLEAEGPTKEGAVFAVAEDLCSSI